ncbi:uncharacterized protein N7477_001190 [Penicillium maclennaniae]|uniref:uncharacterized protein n=1 Tax=Penicillium maclennaniae TaxID=1343394 RepID=UPI002540E438|nr:uncharacterized protein N7477_001190 [Penicillium maclennaniae]KAJ5684845.1 hypothetical protein N7477_001190 [Penicillium maclennaniae]
MSGIMTAILLPRQSLSPDLSPTAQRYFLHDSGILTKSEPMQNVYPARDCSSPVASTISSLPPSPNFTPTDSSFNPNISDLSLSLDDDLDLPVYEGVPVKESDVMSDASEGSATPRSRHTPAADDTSVEEEPSRHVDYLSHEWREEDIWASWRYVTSRRSDYSNGVRLENASWRTWAKAKHNLGTISPETLNWLKDCDVTWLYGPLKTSSSTDDSASDVSPPPSRLDTPNSYMDRKPILKKKTASEAMLQRSLSQHTLLQHAGAILKAQEAVNGWARPPLVRSNTDLDHIHHRTGSSTYSTGKTLTTATSSGLTSPSERRHIHFNDEVEQCIAVDIKEADEDWPATFEDESSSDDEVVMMRQIFSSDSKTIAPLPSTTLKYRGDAPEPKGGCILDRWSALPQSSSLSPTPSVETLRPPSQSANFLLDEDDEDPSLDFTGQNTNKDRGWFVSEDVDELGDRPLKLSASGMFVPYGEGEGEKRPRMVCSDEWSTPSTQRETSPT